MPRAVIGVGPWGIVFSGVGVCFAAYLAQSKYLPRHSIDAKIGTPERQRSAVLLKPVIETVDCIVGAAHVRREYSLKRLSEAQRQAVDAAKFPMLGMLDIVVKC